MGHSEDSPEYFNAVDWIGAAEAKMKDLKEECSPAKKVELKSLRKVSREV